MADSVEEVIYDYLISDSTYTGLFTGVYWYEAPEAVTFPYVVFWQVDDSGAKERLNSERQGEARIQFDIWDNSKIRGVRLRNDTRVKIEDLNETRDGYNLTCIGTNEMTVKRENVQEPFHYVVDGIIKWYK